MTSLTQAQPTATVSTPKWQTSAYWTNIVALLATLIPAVDEWLKANPTEFVSALAGLNIFVQFISSGKWFLKDSKSSLLSSENETTGSGNSDPAPTPVVQAVSTGSTVKLSLLGLLGVVSLAVAPFGLSACGHAVTYDADRGIVISKDGYTVTVTQPAKISYSKK